MTDPLSKSSTHVMSTDSEHFDRDVFEASHQTPIVVDFWAPWCAPCRLLTPVMENLAATYEGRFILVKANTDEVAEAAGRFNVQGIPAVFAVVDGEIVEMFSGALPEDHIRRWLDRILVTRSLAQARRLEATSAAAAEASYRELVANSPQEAAPRIGLARTLQAQERRDDCAEAIAALEQRGFLEPEAEAIKSCARIAADAKRRSRRVATYHGCRTKQWATATSIRGGPGRCATI